MAEPLPKDPMDAVTEIVMTASPEELVQRIQNAAAIAWRFAGYDGQHHKDWVIDKMLLYVLGEEAYQKFVEMYNHGADPLSRWKTGITP